MLKPTALAMSERHWQIVQQILQQYLADYDVWAFGSRTKAQHKPYSDLDLVIKSDVVTPLKLQTQLTDAFEQSDLPWRVDILDWASVSEHFQQIILQHYIVIQHAKKNDED
ncbi:MAG: nucleotidyltransferase domain-containing protein [Acinetobacter sp.]|nr:nucleotidyltransferase domain-containing protein [Acinetobacter sp.]